MIGNTKKEKAFNFIIDRKIRFERGLHWINQPRVILGLLAYINIFIISWGLETPFGMDTFTFNIIILMFGCLAVYLFGEWDYRKGMMLLEARKHSDDYNPFFKEMMSRLQIIEDKIDKRRKI